MSRFPLSLCVCLGLVVTCYGASIVARNTTITVPDNVTSRDGLLCTPTTWTTYVAFYFGNYVAHLATVRTLPGETIFATLFSCLFALVFPSFGVSKGLDAVFRCARIRGRKSPLETAAHSGALCMVVRSWSWKPIFGDHRVSGVMFSSGDYVEKTEEGIPLLPRTPDPSTPSIVIYRAPCLDDGGWFWGHTELKLGGDTVNREIHGTYQLPEGYEWAIVPRQAKVHPNTHSSVAISNLTNGISCSYSAIKAGAAIFQTVYTAFTLYRARGDQINRYGYAAFGLTVAPFAVMSVVNLVGSLLTPDYPSLYMVHSDVMQEAIGRGGCFDGVVGTLETRSKPFRGPTQYTGTLSVQPPYGFDFIPDQVDHGTGPLGSSYGGNAILVPNHPNFERTDLNDVSVDMCNAQAYIERGKTYARRSFFVCLIVSCIPIGIVGYLSGGFKPGMSTLLQRAGTMTWLVVGTQLGYTVASLLVGMGTGKGCLFSLYFIFLFLCYLLPASAGLYVVAGMLKDFGNCIKFY